MSAMSNQSILVVDDEERVLRGIERQQGDEFAITTALGPMHAIERMKQSGPFAVVVSDMRMPEMNGVELLAHVREESPNTVRMILTGFAELSTTISAINQGHIFRFLSKPCDEDDFACALRAGLNQYALVEAEKELLEGTLRESVNVLCEMLSIVNPLAFGQSNRVRSIVDGVLDRLPVSNRWQLEVAAMLSSLGCITLSERLLKKQLDAQLLDEDEHEAFKNHPRTARDLIHAIPRLEDVAEIVANQNRRGTLKSMTNRELAKKIDVLRISVAFDQLESRAPSSLHALNKIKAEYTFVDSEVMDALETFIKTDRVESTTELTPDELVEGMILGVDLRNDAGVLLMSKGQKISKTSKRLIENFSEVNESLNTIKVVAVSSSRAPN
ncbi:MAG: HD domain-containing phosphohydrolase [Planctomycetota bacterium]